MPSPKFVGRSAHTHRLRTALAHAAAGASQVLVLGGVAGAGKTALLDFTAASAPEHALVLRAAGHEAETGIPYAGVHQLLWPVRDSLARLPGEHRRDLSRALAFETGGAPDALAAAGALLALITRLAESRPVVITVDDAQWLDESSRQALVFTARRLDADAVCLVFGVRPEGEADVVGVGTFIEVGPLGDGEARAMLRDRHRELSSFVADRIVERSAGLPLLLSEIPAELTAGQRSGEEPLPSTLPIGRSMGRLYGQRLALLGPEARMALLLASFEPLGPRRLREALSRSSLSIAAFEPAERSGLVRLADGTCEFTHPTVRFAVRSNASARELNEAHAVLAAMFADDPARYAFHIGRTGSASDGVLVPALVAAAEEAANRGGPVEAANAWEAAARHAESEEDRRRFRVEAAEGFMRAGAGPQAAAILRGLIAEARDEKEAALRQRDLMTVRMWTECAPPEDGERLARLGAGLAGARNRDEAEAGTDLLVALVHCHQANGDYRAAKAVAELIRRRVPVSSLTLEQRLCCDMIDVMTAGEGAGELLRSDWIDRFDWSGDFDALSGMLGTVLTWIDEVDACERVIERRRRAAEEAPGRAAAPVTIGTMSAMLAQHLGQWSRALLEFAACERAALDSDFLAPQPFIALRRAYLLAARGEVDACEELRARAARAARRWTPAYRHLDGCVAGLLRLSSGEPAEAARALEEAGRIEAEMGIVVSGYTSRFPDLFEARWRLGDAEGLREELQEFTAVAERMSHPTMLATAARCRALLAGPERLDEAFGEAVALHRRSPVVFEEARTRLLWGQRLRRARRKADARVRLREAEAVFEGLDAAAWAERARSELAACGERRARPEGERRYPIMKLTPREFEVVREVAGGATNSEAAGRLFVSKRTVEYHLSNAYRKLGVSDRRRLAELFDGRGPRERNGP